MDGINLRFRNDCAAARKLLGNFWERYTLLGTVFQWRVVVVVVVMVVCSFKSPTPKGMRESLLSDRRLRSAAPRVIYKSS